MEKRIITELSQAVDVLKANNIALYTFDHSAFYDLYASQCNYDDFKNDHESTSLFFTGRDGLEYIVFFESEAIKNKPYFKISHLQKMKKAELFELCEKLDDYGLYDIEDETKSSLIDRLKSLTNEDYYNKHYENESYHELDYDFSVTGYSQGDAFKVKLVGKVESYINSDYLQNIVYDTPQYIKAIVFLNGEEIADIPLWEHSDFNEYDYYDKDQTIKMFSDLTENDEYHDLLIEYLNDKLPTALGYH